MQYWDEMNTRYGFAEGLCCPAGLEIYRDVYVKTVSKLAEYFGSAYRVVPYDSGGSRNTCLWFYVSKVWFENVYLPKQETGQPWKAVDDDDISAAENDFRDEADYPMVEAVELARELGIDQYIEVQASLSPEFEGFLSDCLREVIRFQAV